MELTPLLVAINLTPEQVANLPAHESPREAADREALDRVNHCLDLAREMRRIRERAARGERIEDPS